MTTQFSSLFNACSRALAHTLTQVRKNPVGSCGSKSKGFVEFFSEIC